MASLIEQPIAVELGASEPWPDNVCLFQPYENKQILLPDAASCVSVRTFLNMCGLKYTVELRNNAENMSPSGIVPFMKIGPFLISELDPIIAFINTKGHHLSDNLNDSERAEMRAYMSLIDKVMVNAELYLTWCETTTYTEVTKIRYGSPYPWPLNIILPWKRQMEIGRKLKALGWAQKTYEEVCEEVRTCCSALSERLGNQQYFFGNRPSEIDALVFGHLFTILSTSQPKMDLAHIVGEFENLAAFCIHIDNKYFTEIWRNDSTAEIQRHQEGNGQTSNGENSDDSFVKLNGD
ncbi:unnamed protein product [Owenia fusiformis]|uniref:Metaxin-2 n=1 Tax=Owenia fusiformis TaxID=6347 RepID=A0A8S4MZY1_OWEFU|nr:unnamed protein product [Owenia fusiformis]